MSHRLSVVNQKMEEKSVTKESQNRYSKAAKDWGWREFVTLTSLFDQDSGFLVQDTVVFSAEVLILKETSVMQEFGDQDTDLSGGSSSSQTDVIWKRGSFTWRVENFLSFKEIMETRKIFSRFFQAGGCDLRIGMTVYKKIVSLVYFLFSVQKIIFISTQVSMSHLTPYVYTWRVTSHLGVIQIRTFGSGIEWLWSIKRILQKPCGRSLPSVQKHGTIQFSNL